ncbi:hypothetical protein [Chryseobacterium sp. 7]
MEKQEKDTSNNYGNWFSALQHLKKSFPKTLFLMKWMKI